MTVEQNIPGDQTAALPGETSRSQRDRKEELSNYELNTKKTSTVSSGYKLENITIAVVVNKRQLVASLGANPAQDAIDKQLKEVERIVETAAGADTARGDKVTVAAVDFVDAERLEPIASAGILEQVMRNMGTFINASAIVIAAVLLVWFGLKPAIRAILEVPPGIAQNQQPQLALAGGSAAPALSMAPPIPDEPEPARRRTPQQRLERMVERDEVAVAAMLKQLMRS